MNSFCVTMVSKCDIASFAESDLFVEFAFYVNKNGRRSRKEFMVHWEGTPQGFGLSLLEAFVSLSLTSL